MTSNRSRSMARVAFGVTVLFALTTGSLTGWAQSDPRLSEGQIAPLLDGMGEHTHPVTAASARVQRFFDQGLSLTFGFNHQQAVRACQEAARLGRTPADVVLTSSRF